MEEQQRAIEKFQWTFGKSEFQIWEKQSQPQDDEVFKFLEENFREKIDMNIEGFLAQDKELLNKRPAPKANVITKANFDDSLTKQLHRLGIPIDDLIQNIQQKIIENQNLNWSKTDTVRQTIMKRLGIDEKALINMFI